MKKKFALKMIEKNNIFLYSYFTRLTMYFD